MAAFPWVKMMVLLTVFVSHWIVNYGTTSYLGYMVQHLNIVDDKDKAGKTHTRVRTRVDCEKREIGLGERVVDHLTLWFVLLVP